MKRTNFSFYIHAFSFSFSYIFYIFAWSGVIYDAIPLSAVRPTSGSGPIVYDLELLVNPLHAMIDRINFRNPDVNSSSSSVEDT